MTFVDAGGGVARTRGVPWACSGGAGGEVLIAGAGTGGVARGVTGASLGVTGGVLLTTGVSLAVGLLATLRLLSRKPLAVLRQE